MVTLRLKNIVYLTVFITLGFFILRDAFPQFNFLTQGLIALAVFLILSVINYSYENLLWDKKWAKLLFPLFFGLQKYPNIAGVWDMKYYSSYKFDWDNEEYITEGTGEIKIQKVNGGFYYSGKFNESEFYSIYNFFEANKYSKNMWVLGYMYTNDPKETNLSKSGFVSHKGFTILNFNKETPDKMEGFYGNDENRKTRGRLILTKHIE